MKLLTPGQAELDNQAAATKRALSDRGYLTDSLLLLFSIQRLMIKRLNSKRS